LSGTLEYNTDLFAPETAARMRGHYEALLADILARPETRLAKLELLTDEEKRRQAAERSEQDEAGLKRLKSARRRSVRLPAPPLGEELSPAQTPNDARDFPSHPDS
jgi:non-ribosomal peptide synthetase component F